MMPQAHGAGHTGCSWDKSWSKGIEARSKSRSRQPLLVGRLPLT